jgi:hypothetical protein
MCLNTELEVVALHSVFLLAEKEYIVFSQKEHRVLPLAVLCSDTCVPLEVVAAIHTYIHIHTYICMYINV